jgi:CRP/FNR family cyclic AMP-dependent transcriptional regulator
MQLQWHLGEADFFRDLPMEKDEFLSHSVRRVLKKNDLIFAEDELANSCFYLEEGSVKISRITLWGKEPIIFVRKAGELFGLAEIIDGKKRKCLAQSISSCILYEIKRKDFEELLARHYCLARRVIQVLGRRLRYLAEQVENLMFCDVTTRLLKLLVYLCYPKLIDLDSADSPIIVPVNLTQEQLAACTGSCQQTVSETLKLLQDEGLIRVSKKQVYILKPFEIMDRILQ